MPKKNNLDDDSRIIKKNLDTYASLESLKESAGGKILVDNLVKDILGAVESLGAKYKQSSRDELVSIIADMDNKNTILKLIIRAKKNKELAVQALKEALLEEGEDPTE